jgi:hypothetical protein
MSAVQIKAVMAGQTDMNKSYSDYAQAYLNCLNAAGSDTTQQTACDTKYNTNTTFATGGAGYDVSTKISSITNDKSAYNTLSAPSTSIDSSYNDMTQLRSSLDLKLQQLYNIDNSIPNLYQSQLDSTVYSGVLWTILATTLIYYVFIKL